MLIVLGSDADFGRISAGSWDERIKPFNPLEINRKEKLTSALSSTPLRLHGNVTPMLYCADLHWRDFRAQAKSRAKDESRIESMGGNYGKQNVT